MRPPLLASLVGWPTLDDAASEVDSDRRNGLGVERQGAQGLAHLRDHGLGLAIGGTDRGRLPGQGRA